MQSAKDQVTLSKTSPSTASGVKPPTVDRASRVAAFAPSKKLLNFINKSRTIPATENDHVRGQMYNMNQAKLHENGMTATEFLANLHAPEVQAKVELADAAYYYLSLAVVHVGEWMKAAEEHYKKTGQPAVITKQQVLDAYGNDVYAATAYVFRILDEKVQNGGNQTIMGRVYFTTQQ